MLRALMAFAVIGALARTSPAQETRAVVGSVVDTNGAGIGRVTVVLAQGTLQATAITDAGGHFRFEAVGPAPYRLLATFGSGKAELSLDGTSDAPVTLVLAPRVETVDIQELPPVQVPAAVETSTMPRRWPYSDEAIDRNGWAVIWLVVLIDAEGKVIDARVLKSPKGFDLDEIAVKTARKLRYRPARDDAGKPIMSRSIIVLQWPPYWGGPPAPCKGSGPLSIQTPDLTEGTGMEDPGTSYRDCDPPKGLEKYRLQDQRQKLKPEGSNHQFQHRHLLTRPKDY